MSSSSDEIAVSHRTTSPRQVFAIVCIGVLLANIDLFAVNIALPKMAAEFHGASLEDVSWVLNAYAIAYAALLVFFGRLSEGYSRDGSFILGVAIFAAAAAAGAAATNLWILVALRVVQAAGAALMTPASLGLLLATFPPDKRGGAVRDWSAVAGLAAALGPLLGGLLVSISWRWIFIVNAAIGAVAILIAWRKLPKVPGHDIERPSFIAALLVTGGTCALIFAIVKINAWGWSSPAISGSIALSAALLALFVWHSLRSQNPLIDPTLFRIRPFTGASLAMFPYSITFGAMLFSVALWGQTAWGWSALETGLAIIPGPLLMSVTSLLLTGKLIARFGTAPVVTAGIVFVIAAFLFWTTCLTLEPNVAYVVLGMSLNGIGVGLTFPTLMGVSTHALPPSSFATGSGMVNMIRQAAIAIGVAVFVAIVGSPASPEERLAAFQIGWWVMAAITAITLIPTLLLLRSVEGMREG